MFLSPTQKMKQEKKIEIASLLKTHGEMRGVSYRNTRNGGDNFKRSKSFKFFNVRKVAKSSFFFPRWELNWKRQKNSQRLIPLNYGGIVEKARLNYINGR